jgi:hypothetical protein
LYMDDTTSSQRKPALAPTNSTPLFDPPVISVEDALQPPGRLQIHAG